MKKITLIAVLLFLVITAYSQNRYLVHLTDKGDVSALNIENVLSPRAIKNHLKNNVAVDELDFPVNTYYVSKLSEVGQVVKQSKWLNAVILTSAKTSAELLQYQFVKEVEHLTSGVISKNDKFKEERKLNQVKALAYDSAGQQNTQIGVDCMHDKGFMGQNVLLAVIDAGFQGMDTISLFDTIYQQSRIIDTYDFIDNDTTVYEKHNHGTMVSSVIAANGPGYIGSAPYVDLCLYITEDVTREVKEEEFDLVRGFERADSVGADLVNVSLSYMIFDTLQGDYTYGDMDGRTTISAKGAQVATKKGLLIVCSAGNSGPAYIRTPCDADSILCIGATDTNSVKASFSSVGPSSDQRVKPDVSAIGQRAFCVDNDGDIRTCNGTSFSSPLTCGMVACLIQAHPLLTMMDFVNSVRQGASQFATPDSLLGYGIPTACTADSILTFLELTTVVKEIDEEMSFNLYPNPSKNYITINSDKFMEHVGFYSLDGRLVKQLKLNGNTALINVQDLSAGAYIVKVNKLMHQRFIKQ
jgi:subtilisin family serine protease